MKKDKTRIDDKYVNIREEMANYIKDSNSRILEIGPLNRSLLDKNKYKNYFFADIRSTEEIRELYSENKYLKKTGINVDQSTIIEIDYVIKGSYKETFKKEEKFDYIIVSHVLEHIPNLLDFLLDVKNIISAKGELIIIYPDRRFSFDYFRSDTKFSDVYSVYKGSSNNLASQVLDFYTNVISENEASKFWKQDNEINLIDINDEKKDIDSYRKVLKGEMEKDIHYWPFSDLAFIKFLYDCKMYGYLPYSIKKFVPTQINTQAFLIILDSNQTIEKDIFEKSMRQARLYFEDNYYQMGRYRENIKALKSYEEKLIRELSNINEKQEELKMQYSKLENRNAQLVTLIEEKSRARYMAKHLIIKIFKFSVKIICYFPKKLLSKLS
jgi:SAM-dependent methyltransferase